jgi:hypothetical protein
MILLGDCLFSLLLGLWVYLLSTGMAGVLLVGLGFAFAVYSILMLCNSMALVPEGKSGTIDVLAGVGAAIGAFLGPYLAEIIGYLPAFLVAGLVFFVAFACLKVFS